MNAFSPPPRLKDLVLLTSDEVDGVENLFVMTAFGGHGVMASPAAGAYSKEVLQGKNRVHGVLSPFTISAEPPETDNATI